MRIGYRTAFLLLAASIAIGGAGASLHTIALDQQPAMRLVAERDDALVFEITVGELVGMDVTTPEGDFTLLSIPGFHQSRDVGNPALPMMNELCEIPYGAAIEVALLESQTRVVRLADHGILHPLMPAQPSLSKSHHL